MNDKQIGVGVFFLSGNLGLVQGGAIIDRRNPPIVLFAAFAGVGFTWFKCDIINHNV